MATQKLSALAVRNTSEDRFHNGTTAFDSPAGVTSDGGDDMESGYTVCLEWDSTAKAIDVVTATEQILNLIRTRGLPADKDA